MHCFRGEYNRKYLSVAIPAALEGIFMTVLQAADLVMVGALGTAAIAAVSIFMPLRLVLLTFARSLASSVTILTANKFGAGDEEGIKALLRQSLTITLLLFSGAGWTYGSQGRLFRNGCGLWLNRYPSRLYLLPIPIPTGYSAGHR